jgi:deazaflavin-dependent oxidoreductase (nitroreductase family)
MQDVLWEFGMWGLIASAVGVLALVLVVVVIAFLFGMRRKSPLVLRTVRRVNRAVVNPRQLRTAGTPGAYASVIRHVGRASGRPYETPVGAFTTDDGFVIALPYGSDPDWLKNVMAAGTATLVHEGSTHQVDRPELITTTAAAPYLPDKEVRTLSRFAVDQCLRLRTADTERAPAHAAGAAGAAG